MKKNYPDLPNWIFNLDEASANIYEVIGTDTYGHRVSNTGIDIEELLEQCRLAAKDIDNSMGEK